VLRILLLLLALSVTAASPAAAEGPLRVTVSILPQKWMVEGVGGGEVEVMVLVGPGHSPATYEPTASQMARLLESDVFFSAGVPFENGLLPRLGRQQDGPMIRGPRHAAGHNHTDLDPHVWLGFEGASAMVDTIRTAFSDLRPTPENQVDPWLYRASRVREDLGEAHDQASELLQDCQGREFFVFHPAFGHFAEAYGLVQIAVEDHGHEPGPRHLAEMIERARDGGARAIVVQPQFSRKSAGAVAREVGAEVVELDPLAADLPANIVRIARTLAGVLGCGEAAP
jgi:zinc transport system substrate-binding protein